MSGKKIDGHSRTRYYSSFQRLMLPFSRCKELKLYKVFTARRWSSRQFMPVLFCIFQPVKARWYASQVYEALFA